MPRLPLQPLAALALLASSATAWGQTITVAPLSVGAGVAAVPVDGPWALGLLLAALALAAWWQLRRGGAAHRVLAWALTGVLGVALWGAGGGRLLASVANAFANPAGQTLTIPIDHTTAGGYFTGFGAQDFTNTSGQPLRITAIVLPNSAQCFTGGAQAASKLLQPGTPVAPGTPCSVGLTLADGDACRVNVDAACRGLLGTPPTLTSSTPPVGTAAAGTGVTLTGTGLATATAVNFGGMPGTGLVVASGTTVTANAPHVGGAMDVTVETPSGMARLANAYSAPYEVGQFVPAQGGVVASMNGAVPDLIAAQADNAQGVKWGNSNSDPHVGTPIQNDTDGSGNTAAIVASLGSSANLAAPICARFNAGGFSDWFLPARNQLNVLFNNQAAIGGFVSGSWYYWSSTGTVIDLSGYLKENVFVIRFDGSDSSYRDKTNGYKVRCVRQFTP